MLRYLLLLAGFEVKWIEYAWFQVWNTCFSVSEPCKNTIFQYPRIPINESRFLSIQVILKSYYFNHSLQKRKSAFWFAHRYLFSKIRAILILHSKSSSKPDDKVCSKKLNRLIPQTDKEHSNQFIQVGC